ncbi:DUF2946 family protein [Bradyrhizobium sp. 61]|uniref:DUF2946 family protein n=1 Tax=unclassified Bradyrhizobium TaxID=2631580 RepID=UPI001FF78C47|nr:MULTISPECIES: DUF2946 family protein [unclassified Bradyrhizobium]MCK1277370.1 DUF2946 family protein [Bradyrhizobium sp. 61]MCK1440962.1 DUF2946 family protein [Bradyrhizobium sp. 48]MCK1465598.1 DUF2946 family protein [Bradyrhizobium sp. 2]
MRRRLQEFLPIVLVALTVQILAPIAACWAAAIAIADPLVSAAICHDSSTSLGRSDQAGGRPAHDGTFATCCVMHAGAWVDTPKYVADITLARWPGRIVWQDTASLLSPSRVGSNTQVRAPPRLT